MYPLFSSLFGLSLLALLFALLKPTVMLHNPNATRKKAAIIYGAITFLFMVLAGSTAPPPKSQVQKVNQPSPTQTQVEVKAEPTTEVPSPTETLKPSPSPTPTPKQTPLRELGQEGYLRIAGNTDATQIIFLAPTKELYDQVLKSLMAKDAEGLLELAGQGVFAVSNGTQVRMIDSAVGLRKVRILKGVRSVDDDKVGMSGWTAMEFTSSN